MSKMYIVTLCCVVLLRERGGDFARRFNTPGCTCISMQTNGQRGEYLPPLIPYLQVFLIAQSYPRGHPTMNPDARKDTTYCVAWLRPPPSRLNGAIVKQWGNVADRIVKRRGDFSLILRWGCLFLVLYIRSHCARVLPCSKQTFTVTCGAIHKGLQSLVPAKLCSTTKYHTIQSARLVYESKMTHADDGLFSSPPRPPDLFDSPNNSPFENQLAIESRVTSDELEQAVGANADKITALQSSVDTALSDRFRRMQDMVHSQVRSYDECTCGIAYTAPFNGWRVLIVCPTVVRVVPRAEITVNL